MYQLLYAMFNIITTYYNNPYTLNNFIEKSFYRYQNFFMENEWDVKLIIIDDGSQYAPLTIDNCWSKLNIETYTIEQDLGFNSHGARNLGMTVTDKDWNLLLDLDDVIVPPFFNTFKKKRFSAETAYYCSHERIDMFGQYSSSYRLVNEFLIHKQLFWETGGYDEEFTGHHYGDGSFLDTVSIVGNVEHVRHMPILNWKSKEDICPTQLTVTPKLNLSEAISLVNERIYSGKFKDKPILNFTWKKN